tara:strand:+ start:1139 stop:2281 length:1143 start_codon:yes stop_codon:yes gene_type:complete
MRVAFIPSTFLPYIGGAEIQTHNLANKLVENGLNIDVLLLDKVSIKNSKYKIIKLNKALMSFVFIFKYYFSLNFGFLLRIYFRKLIKEKNYNVWHFHSVNYKTLIYINELKKLNQKIVVTLQGADIQIDSEIKYGYRLDKKYDDYLKISFQNVDQFHAISSSIISDLQKLKIDSKKIYKIPNCTHINKIEKFKNFNKENKLILLTIGRYAVKKKGFDLIENVASHLKKIVNFKWIIIGRDTQNLLSNNFVKNNLDNFEIIEQIENFDEVYFPHSKLINYYKMSNVYVNLARIEGCPIVVLDALASRIPIITFDTKGGDELVIDGINGFIIKDFNYELFAKKISYFKEFKIDSNNERLLKHLRKYDLEENTKKIIKLYEMI